ncbi:hypothetical protein [Streptomyces sp. L2]|uniref:hypothetical protein n=1 Tax=Streptomyces sp. L2 TaxID=2162665 RepID=UPI0013E97EDE|nr:hypothetical protein [Streptomyces sp. L2]
MTTPAGTGPAAAPTTTAAPAVTPTASPGPTGPNGSASPNGPAGPRAPAAPSPGSGGTAPDPGSGGAHGADHQAGAPNTAQPGGPAAPDNTVGRSESASQATARVGAGSLRAGLLRTAWTRIGGDRVEGDKIVIQAGSERGVVLRALAAGVVETVRHTFQPPPRWDDVVADAWQRRSVVLRGPLGAGKTAAAVRLLLAAQAKTFFLLDSVAELTRLTELTQLGTGAGLLVDRPVDLSELRAAQLAGLEDLLLRADAHLVVTAGPESELGRDVTEYVQRITRPDTLDRVLRAHLTHRLGEPDTDGALTSAGVPGLVTELLDSAAGCLHAARLAEVLAHEHGTGAIDPERVRARMDHTGGETPEEWFESLGDTALRTQAVALAVLGGLPQEHVAMAASALLDRFRSERGVLADSVRDGPVPLSQDPFSQSRRLLADQLRARTVSAVTKGDLGLLPCTVAEYRDPGYPARIIRHVWSEYRIQREIVAWLGALVDKPSLSVRSFAGTALGLIATESFDHIATQVFPGWLHAEHTGAFRREAIAYALRVCLRDPQVRTGVRALVDGWYMSGAWQTQAAAARAYGLCLGGADLATAVQRLTRLGTVDHIDVAIAIGDALSDLLEQDVAGHAPLVLRAVAEMAHEPSSRPSGHLAFLILANALLTEEPPGSTRQPRPSLLTLAAEQPPGHELRRLLGYLWAEVINGELFSDDAGSVLEGWFARAETDPQLLDDMVRHLVEDVARTSPRTAMLLDHHAARWTDPDRFLSLPRSSTVLRAALRAAATPSASSAVGAAAGPSASYARPTQPGGGR